MIAALGMIAAFIAIDLLLFNALRVSLTRSADDSAVSGANQVASLINTGRLPTIVPITGDITIQVLNASGDIVDASAGADRLVPIVSVAQARALASSGGAFLLDGSPLDMPPLLRVVAVPATGGKLVVAAVSFNQASGSLTVLARALVFGTPVLFVAFTWAIWLVTGSTLRPIGALRRGAAAVTGTGVPADLPVPEARDEVRSLALTLNDMLQRLAAAQQRQRALVSDTAHELRSPIASIRTQLEVALDFPDSQDWTETARDVHADVLRLARLTEDLLLLARLDEQAGLAVADGHAADGAGADTARGRALVPGELFRRGQLVDLKALSQSVVCRYAEARVTVTWLVPGPDGAFDVYGVPERLERLLVNLVDNSVRYAKSSVTVAALRNGDWVELSVTDDGPGIPAADRERAFDRFTRLDNARSRDGDEAGGSGLGLAIVRATAQAHGGTASLHGGTASQGEASPTGLRAVVRLPAAPL